MKKARYLLAAIVLLGTAAGVFRPTIYYRPAYKGGQCTISTIPSYSITTDTNTPGEKIELALKPGPCSTYVKLSGKE
ncbi:hypothetical protein ACDQ55_09460 [Chitinophaga sp. 30R24]|uniref:hypothetical protein n=1 Tax=Chitinophaga sp. 30R24 TaxID=3248838 RepID=UPI003B8F2659